MDFVLQDCSTQSCTINADTLDTSKVTEALLEWDLSRVDMMQGIFVIMVFQPEELCMGANLKKKHRVAPNSPLDGRERCHTIVQGEPSGPIHI